MKKSILGILGLALIGISASGQTGINGHFFGEEAFRYSQYNPVGSARATAMGNAFTSLGGDAASAISNPAGFAFYNKSEVSFTPYVSIDNAETQYLGVSNLSTSTNAKVSIGQIGGVFVQNGVGSRLKRKTLAISYNTLANFNRSYTYAGVNNVSSITDYFAQQAFNSGFTPNELSDQFDGNTNLANTPSSLFYNSYLIDPFNDGYAVVETSFPVNQSGKVSETGSLGELNLNFGVNYDDELYLGARVGLQTLNYSVVNYHDEVYPQGTFFRNMDLTDEITNRGVGVNLTLGGIYRPLEALRVGLTVSTPTTLNIKESVYSHINTTPIVTSSFDPLFTSLDLIPNDYNYKTVSPWRSAVGMSYMLPKKVGMLSLDAEYVGYSTMKFKDKQDIAYSDIQTNGINEVYKNVVNLKAGLELRNKDLRVRGSVNYLPDATNFNDGLDRSKTILGLGLGYRSHGFFTDLTYTTFNGVSAYTPYTLDDPTAYGSASVQQRNNNVFLTLGKYF